MLKRLSKDQKTKLELLELKRQNIELKANNLQQQLILLDQEFRKVDSSLNTLIEELNAEIGADIRAFKVDDDGVLLDRNTNQPFNFPDEVKLSENNAAESAK